MCCLCQAVVEGFIIKFHFSIICIQLQHKHIILQHVKLENNMWRETLLTHFISLMVKIRPVMSIRRGMVRIRKKGRAREKGLCFTAHRTARHRTWTRVNRCIFSVLTCTDRTGWKGLKSKQDSTQTTRAQVWRSFCFQLKVISIKLA